MRRELQRLSVVDYFAILGQPRSPMVDAEGLKQAYLRVSAEVHPDKAGVEGKAAAEKESAQLNAAYNTLRQTRPRLLHLLELEGAPTAPHVQNAPPEVLRFFAPVAELTRGADEFLMRKRKASSPMVQAQLFEEGLNWTDRIQALQGQLREQIGGLEGELASLNEIWKKGARPLERVQELAAMLGFFERWNAQLQERLTSLAF